MCASNTTYISDDGMITTNDDDATYAGKCAPLITNVARFFNPVTLPIPTL